MGVPTSNLPYFKFSLHFKDEQLQHILESRLKFPLAPLETAPHLRSPRSHLHHKADDDCCVCWHTRVSLTLAATATKLQRHGPSQTKGRLVTLHGMCWCLCYSSFTVADGNPAGLGHAGQQLGIFVFRDVRAENSTLNRLLFLLCSCLLYWKAWAFRCCGPECLRCKSYFSCLKYRENHLCHLPVERMEPHSKVAKPAVQEGPKTRRWYTCQKPNQSSTRTFCLSRHINEAQINQLWLCKIFLIQAFRWLSSIGKSLNSKKGQKTILLHCLLRTT